MGGSACRPGCSSLPASRRQCVSARSGVSEALKDLTAPKRNLLMIARQSDFSETLDVEFALDWIAFMSSGLYRMSLDPTISFTRLDLPSSTAGGLSTL